MFLPDDFIEALTMQLLSDWANAGLPRLSREQLLIQICLQGRHIFSACSIVADILNVVLSVVLPFSWRQNRVQNALVVWFALNRWQIPLFLLR